MALIQWKGQGITLNKALFVVNYPRDQANHSSWCRHATPDNIMKNFIAFKIFQTMAMNVYCGEIHFVLLGY